MVLKSISGRVYKISEVSDPLIWSTRCIFEFLLLANRESGLKIYVFRADELLDTLEEA